MGSKVPPASRGNVSVEARKHGGLWRSTYTSPPEGQVLGGVQMPLSLSSLVKDACY